jgi:hypothetical protein
MGQSSNGDSLERYMETGDSELDPQSEKRKKAHQQLNINFEGL